MGSADLTLKMALIVAVGVFFASFMDALRARRDISVPTYLLAGLPAALCAGDEQALGGPRLAGVDGTVYQKRLCGLEARHSGDRDVACRLAFRNEIAADGAGEISAIFIAARAAGGGVRGAAPAGAAGRKGRDCAQKADGNCVRGSLVVGAYDGFYGPGTGTFLLLIFCQSGKDGRAAPAGGNVKLVTLPPTWARSLQAS